MFHKLNVGNSAEFLYLLIPPSVGETNNYNLRNHHNICQTTNRLSIFQQSFFSVDDQVMEFIRSENTSTSKFLILQIQIETTLF